MVVLWLLFFELAELMRERFDLVLPARDGGFVARGELDSIDNGLGLLFVDLAVEVRDLVQNDLPLHTRMAVTSSSV